MAKDWRRWWFEVLDPCNFWAYRAVRKWLVPSLSTWLAQNPNVAGSILWQYKAASSNAYAPPGWAHKVAWANWTATQKAELDDAYREAYVWLECGAKQVPMDPNGVTDTPVNVANNVADNQDAAHVQISPAYMWKLYVAHVAFALAAERINLFPWSITPYGTDVLRYLLDSATMGWRIRDDFYTMGTSVNFVPAMRADNLPHTAFASPRWTYPWLRQTGLVGATSLATIFRVLQWMRQNLVHFYGASDFGTFDAVWQYRGYPPLSRIVTGTVDANNPNLGMACYTAGCHGSIGFLCAVLRAANIPVQPVWGCAHQMAHFITDNLYLDHGDDPYNGNVRNSTSPIDSLLIDEATYKQWFTTDLTVNVTGTACANVGRRAGEFV